MTPKITSTRGGQRKNHAVLFVISILIFFVVIGIFRVFFFQKSPPHKNASNVLASAHTSTDPSSRQGAEDLATADFKKTERHWSERIDMIGALRAYEEFLAAAPQNPLGAHQATHTMGGLLYKKLGWGGISFCDQHYTYACYHGFLKQALGSVGLQALTRAYEACQQKNTWERDAICLHGIGHGILAFTGRENLEKALSLCDNIHKRYGLPEKNISGCFSGAFMEYQFWNTHEELISPLDLPASTADSELQKPCATLPQHYRPACYFEQPDWWKEILSRDYKRIGALCEAALSDKERDACFYGLGFTISREPNEGLEQARSICAKMQNADMQKNCIVGTAWFYFRVPKRERWAATLCDELSGEERRRCLNPPIE